jgi:DNA transposition AAA+ family ATPase
MSSPGEAFVSTGEYRRFTEFANAVRQNRYIGLCYGAPGVGKTLSARRYANWDSIEPYLRRRMDSRRHTWPGNAPLTLRGTRTVMWTAPVAVTPRQIEAEVHLWCNTMSTAIRDSWRPGDPDSVYPYPRIELLVVDEADRLRPGPLEQLRDFYDRRPVGLVLIGMPGMERRLARYPQLYSRIGFAHEYRPLSVEELVAVIADHWGTLGLQVPSGEFNDADVIAAVARATGGNLRLVRRLLTEISRILEVNRLASVTKEAVETARQSLIIGPR